MFQEDQGRFCRKTQGTNKLRGKAPKIEKFEEFWAGIWEGIVTEKKFYETVKKRKNWSAPGIDAGVQNFWWKKFRGTWSSILRCFNQWIEQPDEIPEWLTQGRTVLLTKTEDLSNERNYRPSTCLKTCYKIRITSGTGVNWEPFD